MFWMVVAALIASYVLVGVVIVWVVGVVARRYGANILACRVGMFCVLLMMACVFFLWKWFIGPLPRDAEMIEYLHKNMSSYDELISGYIYAGGKGNEGMKTWINDKRKVELQRLVKAKDEMVSPESSQWYGGIIVHYGVGRNKEKINAIEFRIEGGSAILFREKSIGWKSYWYFIDPPELTDSEKCINNGKANKCLSGSMIGVMPSLDNYPLFPGSYDWCGSYMRQIDSHWFIRYVKGCY